MAQNSKIEWTDATWTPIRARNLKTGKVGWHCEHATTGCEFCYSEGFNMRLGTGLPFKPGHRKDIELFLDEEVLLAPLRWKKPRMIFVCSMTDAFADFVTNEWLDKMLAVMARSPQHTFQVLTKRAERMRAYLSDPDLEDRITEIWQKDDPDKETWSLIFPLKNVWLGVSAERQEEWDARKDHLRNTPATVRFVSFEPLLGGINVLADLPHEYKARKEGDPCEVCCVYTNGLHHPHARGAFDWAIVGGESGSRARPMHPPWAREIRDQCAGAGVPFFFKQHGEWISVPDLRNLPDGNGPGFGAYDHCRFDIEADCVRVGKKPAGRLLDGREHNGMPERAT